MDYSNACFVYFRKHVGLQQFFDPERSNSSSYNLSRTGIFYKDEEKKRIEKYCYQYNLN